MAHKKKHERRGPTWQGLYPHRTKTLEEKKRQADRQKKQKGWE